MQEAALLDVEADLRFLFVALSKTFVINGLSQVSPPARNLTGQLA